MAGKKTKQNDDSRSQGQRLREELHQASEEIDEKGLLFLIEQARILIHNAHMERLHHEAQQVSAGNDDESPDTGTAVAIDPSPDGKNFFLSLGTVRKVLTREELRSLAKICQDAPDAVEGRERLHRVLARERRDILADAGVTGPASPVLDALYGLIRSRYRPSAP